jgi:hypothetical protein
MGNAATIAGLGFGNANLGLAHAMGHSFGALFKQPHGRAVALYLPYTIDFTANGGLGRYSDIARFVGLTDSRDEGEGARLLAAKVRELAQAVAQPMSIAAFGIDRADFRELLPKLVEYAEQDTQFFTAPASPNPKNWRRCSSTSTKASRLTSELRGASCEGRKCSCGSPFWYSSAVTRHPSLVIPHSSSFTRHPSPKTSHLRPHMTFGT